MIEILYFQRLLEKDNSDANQRQQKHLNKWIFFLKNPSLQKLTFEFHFLRMPNANRILCEFNLFNFSRSSTIHWTNESEIAKSQYQQCQSVGNGIVFSNLFDWISCTQYLCNDFIKQTARILLHSFYCISLFQIAFVQVK